MGEWEGGGKKDPAFNQWASREWYIVSSSSSSLYPTPRALHTHVHLFSSVIHMWICVEQGYTHISVYLFEWLTNWLTDCVLIFLALNGWVSFSPFVLTRISFCWTAAASKLSWLSHIWQRKKKKSFFPSVPFLVNNCVILSTQSSDSQTYGCIIYRLVGPAADNCKKRLFYLLSGQIKILLDECGKKFPFSVSVSFRRRRFLSPFPSFKTLLFGTQQKAGPKTLQLQKEQ